MWRINVEITDNRVSLILPHRMTARLFQLFKSKKKIIANIDEDFTLYKSLCFPNFLLFDHFVDLPLSEAIWYREINKFQYILYFWKTMDFCFWGLRD